MIVVADTSPFIAPINIGQIELLTKLFESVLVPPQVLDELLGARASQRVRSFANTPPGWLRVQAAKCLLTGLALHAGELAAITLAVEVNANLVLIDERDGRLAAARNNFAVDLSIGERCCFS